MPYYNLKRLVDGQEFATPAADDEEALYLFSRESGKQLTSRPRPEVFFWRRLVIGFLSEATAPSSILSFPQRVLPALARKHRVPGAQLAIHHDGLAWPHATINDQLRAPAQPGGDGPLLHFGI